MNNFKKLLASAMALSMVTSVLPAVSIDVNAADSCSYTDTTVADETAEKIIYDLRVAGYTVYNVPADEPIEWNSLSSVEGKDTVINVLTSLADRLSCATTDEGKHLANFAESVNKLEKSDDDSGYIHVLWRMFDTGVLEDGEVSEEDWTAKADPRNIYKGTVAEFYQDVLDTEPYIGNMSSSINKAEEGRVELYVDQLAEFKDLVADYKNEYYEEFLDEFVTYLTGDDENEGVFTNELAALEDGNTYSRSNLNNLKTRLEKVKESDEYALYGDEDEVVEIIDAIEGMVADIETVNELLDSSSDAQRALRAVRSDVNRLAAAVGNDEDVLDVIDTFTAEDIENVQTYVEEVVYEFYTFETKQRSSGRYYVDDEPTELAMYIEDGEVNKNVLTILTTILDSDLRSEDTIYDVLVDTDTTVVTKADLIAIVEDAEGVELKWTYTTGEVDLVVDALDALDALLADGNPYGLTARERRTLTSEQTRLNRIWSRMENAEAEIIVTKDWWVFENGQWVFYQDGRTVSNVWVADHNNDWYYAGANGVMLTNSWIARDSSLQVWYYVGADGKMVTNTVVDGCTIDANGVWHA